MEPEPFQLESPSQPVELEKDLRPRVPEPLPVRHLAVADLSLPATCGLETDLDAFYVVLLQFEKSPHSPSPQYRADNFSLRFDLREGLVERDGYRPVGIEILSLQETEQKLIDAEIQYTRQRGLIPGQDSLALLDPAGNMIELFERRAIM